MEKLLDEIYYDRALVRKTIENVLKRAKEEDASITREDVKAFIEAQEVRQETTRKRKEGSYVASAAREEFEADLADFGALAVPRYALVCVDCSRAWARPSPSAVSRPRPWSRPSTRSCDR